MIDLRVTFNCLLTALVLSYATSAFAQDAGGDVLSEDPDVLLDRLGTLTAPEDAVEARRIAREIEERWSHSGSAAMDLLLARGREAMEAGEYPKAIAHLTALTDTAPGWSEGWALRATAFYLAERWGAALSDIEQALILEPRHFNALAGLGIIMAQLDEPELALRAFRKANQIHPGDENVLRAIGQLEQETGERPV